MKSTKCVYLPNPFKKYDQMTGQGFPSPRVLWADVMSISSPLPAPTLRPVASCPPQHVFLCRLRVLLSSGPSMWRAGNREQQWTAGSFGFN